MPSYNCLQCHETFESPWEIKNHPNPKTFCSEECQEDWGKRWIAPEVEE